MDAFELITTRRSTRRFSDKPLEREKLEKIIEAGRHAPSGGNNQNTHFIVITNRGILDRLAVMVSEEFATWEITPGMYPSMEKTIRNARDNKLIFHYNAPALIITANKKDYTNNMADCACALENMMLMANALDLGSCWINQLNRLCGDKRVRRVLTMAGVNPDHDVFGCCALGYSDTEGEIFKEKRNKIVICK